MSFENHLYRELKESRFNQYDNNYDTFFRGAVPQNENSLTLFVKKIKELLLYRNASFVDAFGSLYDGIKNVVIYIIAPKIYFHKTLKENSKFAEFYEMLHDDFSRNLLVKLIAYRVLGFRKVKLPRNNRSYWDSIEYAKTLDTRDVAINIPFLTWPLHCFNTQALGFDMRVYTYAQGLAINFIQKQYEFRRCGYSCEVEPGDVVIDAGGCWGDTSLQFACKTGPDGHVYVFEFAPSNLDVMYKNFELNPVLAPQITIVERPVGLNTSEKLFFFENGPASRVAATKVDERYIECEVLSIDDLVLQDNLQKVDFIKMDIEGSELDALKGAEKTIRRFRPKLAICIYHKPDDYLTIPKYLNELNLNYEFHIDHHTIFLGETVLFAVPLPISDVV